MDQEKIGKFIASCRKEAHLTQEQLAERIGVSNKSISRWENGITMPDLSILNVLANELNIEISELLNGRKMTREELISLRDSINNAINYSNLEKSNKTQKLNIYFMAGLFCFVCMILNNMFGILETIFSTNISEFVSGALSGLGLTFEFIGLYNNNHDMTLRQKKRCIFKKENRCIEKLK